MYSLAAALSAVTYFSRCELGVPELMTYYNYTCYYDNAHNNDNIY